MTDATPGGGVLEVPSLLKELGARYAGAGYDLHLVGGTVRDLLLGREAPDWDLATDAHPRETTRILQGWADRRYFVGVKFGTVGALKDGHLLEITTYREEVYVAEHRKPTVTFGKDLETDLSRRDFTINAMAVKVPEGTFVDPFGGVKALAARLLDTPLDPETSFGDDPLRMIRAARFVAQLGVKPSERVVSAMRALAGRLEIVAPERMQGELDRLLMAEDASAGLDLLVGSGVADVFLPELPALAAGTGPRPSAQGRAAAHVRGRRRDRASVAAPPGRAAP